MSEIEALIKERDRLKRDLSEAEAELLKYRVAEYEKDPLIKKAIIDCEKSKNFTSNSSGEICSWLRFDDTPYDREALNEMLGEYFIELDTKNDCILMRQGPSIIINEDGDILDEDSGKWIIKHKDYETEKERNELIEKLMKDNGYFPGVFSVSRYGDIELVNTTDRSDGDDNI